MATSREMGARCRMLPWRTPVTEDPPDHQVADRSTTLHSLLISTRELPLLNVFARLHTSIAVFRLVMSCAWGVARL